jgi:hypothetical protein
MNKPDWKDAPHWANYLAMNEDGGWYWYKNGPVEDYGRWYAGGLFMIAGAKPSNHRATLEQRQ